MLLLDFKQLELYHCHFPIAKLLVQSRRFDYVKIDHFIFKSLEDIHIDTDRLELWGDFYDGILNAEFIRTNSLIIHYSEKDFNDNLITNDIGLVFYFY